MKKFEDRHPSTEHMLQYFEFERLPKDLEDTVRMFNKVAHDLVNMLPDSPELTAGLRKLLEAKDCAVRAMVDTKRVDYRDR